MQNILVTGGAGFIGSNLTLELQSRFPQARIVVIDDFRSGHFSNLNGFRGDILAHDVSKSDWTTSFHDTTFDVIFHEASITDTTVHDQSLQVRNNVEGFRNILQFARKTMTPVVYASSAAVYGTGGGKMSEQSPSAPANIYAFSKVHLDNLARIHAEQHPAWKIVGVRYFNVYGPGEGHKEKAASMIYQLYLQMKAGKRPRVFASGEHKRDFVYIKDVLECTIQAFSAPRSMVLNCGSSHPFSFNDVIATLNRCLQTEFEPEYFDNPYPFYQPHTEADMQKAELELGFKPQWTPDAGISDYIHQLEKRP